jgi:hypothetical protein
MSTDTKQNIEQDVRLIQRNLAKGFISRADIDRRLASLPDVADKGEWIDIMPEETAASEED